MPVRYNLDFQLTQKDARVIAEAALNLYEFRFYNWTSARIPFTRRELLNSSIREAFEAMFKEKFERELNVDYTGSCRMVLIASALLYITEMIKTNEHNATRAVCDFAVACSSEIEEVAEQMRERNNPESEYYETEPTDGNGQSIEYELAEDVAHAWNEQDWTEFSKWDDDFGGVASFAVVSISE